MVLTAKGQRLPKVLHKVRIKKGLSYYLEVV